MNSCYKLIIFVFTLGLLFSGCTQFDPTTITPSKLMTDKNWVFVYNDGYNISGTSTQPKIQFKKQGILKRGVAHHVKNMNGPKLNISNAEQLIMNWLNERVNVIKNQKLQDNENMLVWEINYDAEQYDGTIKLIIRRCRENDKYTDPNFDIRYDLDIVEQVKLP